MKDDFDGKDYDNNIETIRYDNKKVKQTIRSQITKNKRNRQK